jgi:tetrahydromethanopterin S-methyltransferase subunit G
MSTMISEVYDALKEAGASEEKARKAAEALASYENRFTQLDRALDTLDRKLEQRFARVDERFAKADGEMALLRWMIGFNLALTVAILWKVFST